MLDENKLKNCPFCGSKPSVWIVDRIIKIRCEKCKYERYFNGIITPVPHKVEAGNDEYYNPNAYEEAVNAWNKRVENEASTADEQEVRHGKWCDGRCTCCGWEIPDRCSYYGYDDEPLERTPYCPNCGAKMDKE